MKNRMQEHRRKGKFTNGYEIVASFDSAIEAHYIETKLHLLGYNGFYYKGLKI